MKFKSLLVLLFFFYFYASYLFSQSYLGPRVGIKYGNLQKDAAIDFFDSSLGYSTGLLFRKNFKNHIYFTSNFFIENIALLQEFSSNANLNEVFLKGNAFALSADLGYYIFDLRKFKLGVASGLKVAKTFSSTFDYFPKAPDSVLLGTSSGHVTLEARADFSFKISNRNFLSISPHYSFILQKETTNHQIRNLGIQASLLFMLSKSK